MPGFGGEEGKNPQEQIASQVAFKQRGFDYKVGDQIQMADGLYRVEGFEFWPLPEARREGQTPEPTICLVRIDMQTFLGEVGGEKHTEEDEPRRWVLGLKRAEEELPKSGSGSARS